MKLLKLGTTILATLALVACGGSSGGEAGKESLPINKEQSEEKVQQLADGDGYFVKFKYSSSDNGEQGEENVMSYGIKGDVFWVIMDDGGMAIKQDETNYYYYSMSDGEFEYESSLSKEQADQMGVSYQAIYSNWLYFGNTYDGQLTKGKDTTVAGRSCYTYTFNYSSIDLGAYASMVEGLADLKVEYMIAVDKELGLTMKLEIAGQADGESGSFSFEVLEFKTGSAIQVPNLPAPVQQNAD